MLENVQGYESLGRDPKTGAVINKSKKEFAEFMSQKKIREMEKQQIVNLEQRIARLEQLLSSK